MAIFSDMRDALKALHSVIGEDVEALAVPATMGALSDEAVLRVIGTASDLVRTAESLRIAACGVVAARSTPTDGHRGLAQSRGHRSPAALIQDLTGATRAEATRQVRVGASITTPRAPVGAGVDTGAPRADARPWHAPLGDALLTGALTAAQHDAILRGLGDPPSPVEPGLAGDDAELAAQSARDAWATAAAQFVDEAPLRTVEELAQGARTVRDLLDPVGARRRFDERFEGRSFRMWTDAAGTRRASIAFDDEGAAWMTAIIDTALRPRRGGPRFVDPAEAERAAQLSDDQRTNDQLTYDLVLDTLRAGSLADAETVFGTRQAGVRIVVPADSLDASRAGDPTVAVLEGSDVSVPGWLAGTRACDSSVTECTLDPAGNPLDLGREMRLYSARQRLALAIRDGGCRWHGCDRPASYCEAHHIDPYAQGGRTDIDRGILLCRFHHMQLHHGRWRITRNGTGDFVLHPPDGGAPTTLPARLPRRYAWGDLRPPPRRFRPTG